MIRSPLLLLEAFRHYLFPDAFSGHYRPVQTVSYIFDYYFWHTDTFGYHLSNICWHIASGIALYFLLRRLLPALSAARASESFSNVTAFLVALLWMVHPVHSAAVDYISGRADSLAFFLAAGGWLLYLRGRETAGRSLRFCFYLLASVAALLALCSRESGLMWMLVFLGHLFFIERAVTLRSKVAVLSVCLLITGAYGGLRSLPESRPEPAPAAQWSVTTQGPLMLRALGDYTRLVFFPTNLHLERSVAGRAGGDYLILGGIVAFALLLYAAWRPGLGQGTRLFGAGWFLITYLPISNLFRLNATVAEHWLYLPSVGILILFAGVVLELPARYQRAAVSAACLAVIALTARSAMRSSDWIDSETFFRRTFAAGGSNSRIGVNLAVVYARRGEHGKAEEILRKVLERSPQYALARSNLALALSQQGKTAEAASMFQGASTPRSGTIAMYEPTPDAALHLAQMQHAHGKTDIALAILAEAREEFPGIWSLIKLESGIRRAIGGPDGALQLVEEFARDHWWHAGAALSLALLYMEKDDLGRADAALHQASRLDVYDARALNLRASIQLKQNRISEAYQIQRRAIERRPDEPRQYLILADILTRMGRTEDAEAVFALASRMQVAAAGHATL